MSDENFDGWIEELTPYNNIISSAIQTQVKEATSTYKTNMMDMVKIAAYGAMKRKEWHEQCVYFTSTTGRCKENAVKKDANKFGDYYFCSQHKGRASTFFQKDCNCDAQEFNKHFKKKLDDYAKIKEKVQGIGKSSTANAPAIALNIAPVAQTTSVQPRQLIDVPDIGPLIAENKQLHQELNTFREQFAKVVNDLNEWKRYVDDQIPQMKTINDNFKQVFEVIDYLQDKEIVPENFHKENESPASSSSDDAKA